jgi:hypothetical protein
VQLPAVQVHVVPPLGMLPTVHDSPEPELDPELELLPDPELEPLDELEVVDVPELEFSAPELLDDGAPEELVAVAEPPEELVLADEPELPEPELPDVDSPPDPDPVSPMMAEEPPPGADEHAARAATAQVSNRDERALISHTFFSRGTARRGLGAGTRVMEREVADLFSSALFASTRGE